MNRLKINAYAKINLSLDVLGTLPNGYHVVRMIMQSISLHDTLEISSADGDSIILNCDNGDLVCDNSNLIIRAAKLLMQEVGKHDAINISLRKRIPMAAGLAGGSADAAATLIGINEFMGYGLSMDALKAIGAGLGADIPFCIQGGTCLSEGIGEILTPVSPMPDCHIVLVKPPVDVSTKYVYEHLLLNDTTGHPDVTGMIDCLKRSDLAGITEGLGNILETVTVNAYPEITKIKNALVKYGASGALMSGSGPTVFGLFDDESKANEAMTRISDEMHYSNVHLCHPVFYGTKKV
ncbi:MAG: 4-(cytidine 5'-diphospho)-2-C-methyl-D-erythritol kinase [Lachnospiraceae bacterium]|nr:4-(cytidine 5'-diphospho)-2-C-methyl-D-erythritol kinase [Lachnospiraceae bacterium]